VIGVDFVPALLERARERAHAERFKRCTFELGDAEKLLFDDHSFDVVLSTFGCMFAPDPQLAARELMRVVKPGGRIGIAAWTPDGLWGRTFAVHDRYLPAPDGTPRPPMWGEEAVVRERFADRAREFSFTQRRHIIRARETDQFFPYLCRFFGPTIKVWETLDGVRRASFAQEINAVLAGFNESGDATLFAPAEYLESVITLK
jgi:ubiquinone/menaquinone biosynthesis C-methylase UbiE